MTGNLALLIAVGFALRCVFLFLDGMADVSFYALWGNQIREQGLMGFTGIYFPLQFQLFSVPAAVADWFQIKPHTSLKCFNLLFEILTLGLLLELVGPSRRIAAVIWYWLNPYFLVLFALGYCDFQICFFVVLAIWSAFRFPGSLGSVLAASSVACAFLMKPQAIVIVLAIGLFGVMRPHRLWQTVAILLPAGVLFVLYSAMFVAHGAPITHLARFYFGTATTMPCLTAHMVNVWYSLAVLVTWPRPEFTMSDSLLLWGPIQYRHLAIALMVALLVIYMIGLSKTITTKWYSWDVWLKLLTFATLVLPMIMTEAHENHLFLGAALLVLSLVIAEERPSPLLFGSVIALLLVQTFNIVGLYGLGNNFLLKSALIEGIRQGWKPESVKVIAGGFTIVTWLVLIRALFVQVGSRLPRWYPLAPIVLIVGVLGAVSLTTWLRLPEIRSTFPVAENKASNAIR